MMGEEEFLSQQACTKRQQDSTVAQKTADPGGGGQGSGSGAQAAVDNSLPPELATYFEVLYGAEGRVLLKAFQDAGGKVVMERWMFLGAESDFDYSPVMQIQINQKVNPAKAASLLMEHLIEASGTTWVRQFLPMTDQATQADLDRLQLSNEVAFKSAAGMSAMLAELYVSGVGIVNEPADFVINVDAAFKGNHTQAALGMLPFLPSGNS